MRRHAWLLIVLAVLGGAIGYGVASLQDDEFESSATLLFRDRQLAAIVGDGIVPDGGDPVRRAATNVDLVSSNEVARRTQAALGDQEALGDLTDRVSIASEGNSDLVVITARDTVPARAARVANTWAVQYIEFRREADQREIQRTVELINRRLASLPELQRIGPEGQALRQQRDQLEIASSLQTGNAEVVERARPSSSPVAPRPKLSAFVGGLVGLLVAGLGIVVIERLDRRLDDAGSLEREYGLPLLGQVPRSARLQPPQRGKPPRQTIPGVGAAEGPGAAAPVATLGDLTPEGREAFRVLRTGIAYAGVDRDVRSILVTSAGPGEGKTSVSLNLGRAYSEAGSRTLVLDTDLRRSTMAEVLGVPGTKGLAQVLIGEARLEGVLHRVHTGPKGRSGRVGHLDVICAGANPPNPQELLEGRLMEGILDGLLEKYDTVIADTTPVVGLGDPVALMRRLDAVLIVSRIKLTTTSQIRDLRARLDLLGVRPVGLVVNGVRKTGTYYSDLDRGR